MERNIKQVSQVLERNINLISSFKKREKNNSNRKRLLYLSKF